jgi:hypothetical protein
MPSGNDQGKYNQVQPYMADVFIANPFSAGQ